MSSCLPEVAHHLDAVWRSYITQKPMGPKPMGPEIATDAQTVMDFLM